MQPEPRVRPAPPSSAEPSADASATQTPDRASRGTAAAAGADDDGPGTRTREEVNRDGRGPYADLDHTGTPPPPSREGAAPHTAWTPDYDGRPDSTRAEDVLIWGPRAILLPAHLVLEYLVRWPVVSLITVAEEAHAFETIADFFTFADGDAAIFPSAFYDAGRGLWLSANFFYENLGVRGHRIDASAGYGTSGWYQLAVGDEWTLFDGDTGRLRFDGVLVKDPTLAFAGTGPNSDIDNQGFYSAEEIRLSAALTGRLDGLSEGAVRFGFRQSELSGGQRPSVRNRFDTAELPGFGDRYRLLSAGASLVLDSRDEERDFTPGSGVRLELFGSAHLAVDDSDIRYLRYGAKPVLFWDVTGVNHVLAVSTHLEALAVDGDADALPIHELIAIGGNEHMRGFLPGRFRGQSALVHSVAYTWPVLFFADGMVFAEVGSAFDGFFERLSYARMSADWGFGLRSGLSREIGVGVLLAFGTNRLGQWDDPGLRIDNVRFIFGATGAI